MNVLTASHSDAYRAVLCASFGTPSAGVGGSVSECRSWSVVLTLLVPYRHFRLHTPLQASDVLEALRTKLVVETRPDGNLRAKVDNRNRNPYRPTAQLSIKQQSGMSEVEGRIRISVFRYVALLALCEFFYLNRILNGAEVLGIAILLHVSFILFGFLPEANDLQSRIHAALDQRQSPAVEG